MTQQEQMDALMKSVADINANIAAQKEGYEATVQKMLAEVLKTHPGVSGQRKMVFPDGVAGERLAALDAMPAEIQAKCDEMFILGSMLKQDPRTLKSWSRFQREAGDYLKKAMDTQTSGDGLEWVMTGFSSNLIDMVRLESKVWGLFDQITMPSNPYKLPIQIGRLNTFKHPEQTADTGQTAIPVADGNDLTGAVTLTAVGHAAYVMLSKDLEEDSIVPMLPWLRKEIVNALIEGREDCILNGDTNATHEDSDTTSATSRRKMWLGLRAAAHDNSYTFDMGTNSLTNYRALRALMGRYGIKPADMVIITGMRGYLQMLNFPQVETVDKYGSNATVLNGELAKLDGSPIVVSEWVREDLDANGVYNAAGDLTVAYIVNKKGFVTGVRRDATVQLLTEKYAEFDQDALKVRERVTFSPVYALAANKSVYLAQNIGA